MKAKLRSKQSIALRDSPLASDGHFPWFNGLRVCHSPNRNLARGRSREPFPRNLTAPKVIVLQLRSTPSSAKQRKAWAAEKQRRRTLKKISTTMLGLESIIQNLRTPKSRRKSAKPDCLGAINGRFWRPSASKKQRIGINTSDETVLNHQIQLFHSFHHYEY